MKKIAVIDRRVDEGRNESTNKSRKSKRRKTSHIRSSLSASYPQVIRLLSASYPHTRYRIRNYPYAIGNYLHDIREAIRDDDECCVCCPDDAAQEKAEATAKERWRRIIVVLGWSRRAALIFCSAPPMSPGFMSDS